MVKDLTIDATFTDGLKRIKIYDPICSDYGDFEFTFYGSFLPKPSLEFFNINTSKLEHQSDVHMSNNDSANNSDATLNNNNPGTIIPFKVNLNLDEGEITEINTSNVTSLSNFIDLNKDKGASILLSVNNLSNQAIRVNKYFR